jgi:carboxypeptidase Taq
VAEGSPAALSRLQERAAELADLAKIGSLMFWDRSTKMPPGGAFARAEQSATLERVHHAKLTDPEIGRWFEEVEPWLADQDPDSDVVLGTHLFRRDHEKAVRVPADLAAEIARADALGEHAWSEAKRADDFSLLRDALAHTFELRHRYVECFDEFTHPYDALLDNYEPGFTTEQVRPLLAELREVMVPLVAAAGDAEQARNGGVLHGQFPEPVQDAALLDVISAMGFDPAGWRLDYAQHPFAQTMSVTDVRITTNYDTRDFGVALYSVLHEFGHGLYDAGVDPALERTPLGETESLGLHESQSRMWENIIGRSEPFARWALPRLQASLGGLEGLTPERMFWGVNTVQPSRIRIYADETTYNLHIILRFELEVAVLEGTLGVDDLPQAWDDGMQRLLGVEVRRPSEGILQDVHWGAGLIGYFPTYSLGNLIGAQLWEKLREDVGDTDELIARGEFAPIRDWLRENIHRHGRRHRMPETLRRATGAELSVEPFARYLRGKLEAAGVLAATP